MAVAGICLINLDDIRPAGLPAALGISSENAAHRIAVEWNEGSEVREGVFIPRRDTNSMINHLAGGRLFPGEHHLADFSVNFDGAGIDFSMQSRDRAVTVHLQARVAKKLNSDSIFESTADASRFFEPGSIGYAATSQPGRFDGVELRTFRWAVEPLSVDSVHSSYFADARAFPPGSATFDCALLMRDIQHEWRSRENLYVQDTPSRYSTSHTRRTER